jgi:UDP-N-acetylglucosamine 2-epimerase
MKIITNLGTRPEITKLSPLLPLLDEGFDHLLIHTGQHYDHNMDKIFFEELGLVKPDYLLGIGSRAREEQIEVMQEKIKEVLIKEKPNLVIVQGDTNTTLAGAQAASKLKIPLMHIEAGCRSFNEEMPEEKNRVAVDKISDYLITPDEQGVQNLLDEGISKGKVFLLGSTVFDAVLRNKRLISDEVISNWGLGKKDYLLVTLHRAENTDNLKVLREIIDALNNLAERTTLVFPIHPRTKKILENNQIYLNEEIKVIEPQSYLNFLALLSGCKFCLSDSGGIQEEALACEVPCLILRNETEWMRIVESGKNILVGTNKEKIISSAKILLDTEEELQKIKERESPFQGGASEKIIKLIKTIENDSSHS